MKGVPVASGGSLSLRATILVPTFDHGPTLRYSLASALAQTVEEIEVIVVGDGAPPGTDELMGELCAGDPRLSFVPHPKGPRNGEAYRDGILARARGEIVCYLADDDLWFPDHVETMLELLAEADFAHGLPLRIEPDGTVAGWIVDLEQELFRDEILAGRNRIPLTCGAHTLAAYRRLPEGWTTTPAGIPTDVHFWQKLMGLPGLQMVSGTRPTSLHFPSPDRRAWSGVQRVEELERWWKRVREPGERVQLLEETLDYVVRDRARVEAHVLWLGRVQEALEQAQLALDRVYASLTWRLRERLLAIPLVRGGRQDARTTQEAVRGLLAGLGPAPRRPHPRCDNVGPVDGVVVALVGHGKWGRHVLRDLVALNCRVTVVSRGLRARDAVLEAGAAGVVATVGELPEETLGVVVVTPTTTHAAVVEPILASGLPVFVEKPLADDAEDATRLAESAPDRLFVMHKWRYHPGIELLAEIARSGELGPVVGLRTTRVGWGNPHGDLDAIWMLAPHDISIALEVLGEIPEPRAATAEYVSGTATGMTAVLGDDPWFAFDVSTAHPIRRREVRLICRGGVAVLADAYSDVVLVARGELHETVRLDEERRPISTELPLLRELRAFVEHLEGGPPPRSSAAEGAAEVATISRLRELAGLAAASVVP